MVQVLRGVVESDFCEVVFVRVADHSGDAGQGGDFCGSTLCVATGDDDFGERILALHAADGGAGVLIGGICNGTGVQDYEVGFTGRGAGQAARFELAFDRGAVGLRGATSEIFDVVGAHRTIVAQ